MKPYCDTLVCKPSPRLTLVAGFLCTSLCLSAVGPLPETEALEWPEADLSERLMAGAHRFVERKIEEAARDRAQYWAYVDAERIGFYGLSYGGETALRVPPILEGYALSICAGDFNQWTRKVASTDEPFSFMRTIEWEMPYWNLGHTFDYAEMAYLMIPRPFMVERGHLDSVGRDHWVAHEYAKVRWLYAQLGLADRTAIEFFQGGHSLNCQGTFDFLRKHLAWPKNGTR
jgi:hypothetical protein